MRQCIRQPRLYGHSSSRFVRHLCLTVAISLPVLASAEDDISLLATQAASATVSLEDIAGIAAPAPDRIMIADGVSGNLSVTGTPPRQFILTPRQGLFGGRRLGGVAVIDADLTAVAISTDDFVQVVDTQGEARYRIGESGSRDGQLKRPGGLALSAHQRLYVADTGNDRISVFTPEGVFLTQFGAGRAPEGLDKPSQVAVDNDDRVYVLDAAGGGRISVFEADGRLLKQLPAARLGLGEARLSALTVTPAGLVLVADKANGKIALLDWNAGKVVRSFGSKGAGRGQFGDVTVLTLDQDNHLLVGDSGNHRIESYSLALPSPVAADPLEGARLAGLRRGPVYKADCDIVYPLPAGELLCVDRTTPAVRRLNTEGKPVGKLDAKFHKPVAVAWDDKDIAVIDGDEVKLFSHDGKLRFSVGRGGSRDGEFDGPEGVFLGKRIYVADTGNRRVQVFSRDGVFLEKFTAAKGQSELLRKPGRLVVDSQGNIYVADNGLNKVRVLDAGGRLSFDIGADDKSPLRFESLIDLAIDRDDNLYVLAATPNNAASVQVYSGPRQIFAFEAAGERIGLARPTALAVPRNARTSVAVYDAGRKRLVSYSYLQVPSRVGGIGVRGGPRDTRLLWQPVPGSYVNRYRVYGAADDDGPYKLVQDTAESAVTLSGNERPTFYRVSAVSALGVEGPASPAQGDLFQAAYRDYLARNYEKAAAGFARAYQADGSHAAALEYRGRSYMELGKSDDALRDFQELARLDGYATTGVNLQAEALMRARQLLIARNTLEQLIAARRADAATYRLCGDAALQLGDSIGAIDCLERALKLDERNAETHFQLGQVYVRMGAVSKGLGEFDAAVNIAPQDPQVWLQGGLGYQALGRHDEALVRFNKALSLDGLNAEARLGAARSYIALKSYDKARNIALSLSGDAAQEATGQYLLGVIALASNHPQDAVLALSKAGLKDSKNAAVWVALADAQLALKNNAKAKEALRQAVAADARAYSAAFRLGQMEMQDRNYAPAAEAYDKAVDAEPGNYEARYAYAQALLAAERWRDAADQAREAARLQPKKSEPLVLAAESARAQGKSGDAIEALKQALVLAPNVAAIHSLLGQTYLDNNIYDLAQTHLDKAAILDPRSAPVQEALGQMYMERQLYDSAIKAYNKAVALNPGADNKLRLNAAYAEKKKSQDFKQNAPRIVIEDLRLDKVFSSAYKDYASRPLGQVRVRNASNVEYKGLKLSLYIKGYMDFPSSQEIAVLPAGGTVELPLTASFNNRILGVDEDTGVQAEVKVSFTQDGQQASVDVTRPMTLYGKNAIQWANFAMVGSFVTPKDDTLKDFVRQTVTQARPPSGAQGRLNDNLIKAMTLFEVLSAQGIKYLADPNSPYSKISAEQVDYVQFPRETLKLRSGDCDDLSVLLAAGLENLGIETALVDVPGHLFLLFNTGVAQKSADSLNLRDDMMVMYDGQVWIPVETTMIATSFSESWAEGARRYQEGLNARQLKVVKLKDAWSRYVPVTLAPAAGAIEQPAADKLAARVDREYRILVARSLDRQTLPYRTVLAANPKDTTALLQIGIVYAQAGLGDQALKYFDQLLAANPRSAEAHNNRGNVYYNQGDYERAADAYAYAEQLDPGDAGIKINLALSEYRRGHVKEAADKFREAAAMNQELAGDYKGFDKLLTR